VNDVAELKQYVAVHAPGQRIPRYEQVLDRIRSDDTGPGSWTAEWCATGDRLSERGQHLLACRHYIMGRFPYVDGPAREAASGKVLESFDRWRAGQDIHRLEVDVGGELLGCWQTGLSAVDRRPLIIVMGGIVSVKEQWTPGLMVFRRLGLAAIAVDMPGIGENPVRYDAESWRFLSKLLDAVSDRADVSQTYALALSFSGHMALRCAMEDKRIRGVITAGAPISSFFTDTEWQSRLPRVTVDTLAHLTGAEVRAMRDWALPADQLSTMDTSVAYIASTRDEIIPTRDVQLLRETVRDCCVLEHDDIHAAPDHVLESKLWAALSLQRMRGTGSMSRAVLSLLWRTTRALGRL
jgi:hypothetical protein